MSKLELFKDRFFRWAVDEVPHLTFRREDISCVVTENGYLVTLPATDPEWIVGPYFVTSEQIDHYGTTH